MQQESSWATTEFENVDLGDTRLNERLAGLCSRFSDSPESPINQACEDWAETKAAYRFFGNTNVSASAITNAHVHKTAERVAAHKTILAIQDTSYFIYTSHLKTKGLGRLASKKGKNVDDIPSTGLLMHACLAVATDGTPLGLLDQQIYSRTYDVCRRTEPHVSIPIEDKESYRWLSSLRQVNLHAEGPRIVTVCDREADIYEFFEESAGLKAPVLVRARIDRTISKGDASITSGGTTLWRHMAEQPIAGSIAIKVPLRRKSKQHQERAPRTALISIRFGSFQLIPPRNLVYNRDKTPPPLPMFAVYAVETNPPEGVEPVEWMLLTNLAVTTFDQACEKIRWYSLRWRIEMYFKVLKSGFNVEMCRLEHANRLIKYLAVMSVVAWRLFMITLIARATPCTPCSELLADHEWKILFMKINKSHKLPEKVPTIGEVVIWIARLGGFLARKGDGMPGTITLWRGWKRLMDLAEGWSLASERICG
ncbi:MAG: IS4 family transposase [bacterium]|jgi:hypothetical protein